MVNRIGFAQCPLDAFDYSCLLALEITLRHIALETSNGLGYLRPDIL